MVLISVLATILLIIDQISKILIATHFNHIPVVDPLEGIPIINNILYFSYDTNNGAAFGMLGGESWSRIFFIVVTVIVCVVFIIWLIKQPQKNIWLKISSAMMLSGAVGNLIDRVFIGQVRDFIYVNIPFATFNFADSCLVVGTIVMAIYILFIHEKHIASIKSDCVDLKQMPKEFVIDNEECNNNNEDNDEI